MHLPLSIYSGFSFSSYFLVLWDGGCTIWYTYQITLKMAFVYLNWFTLDLLYVCLQYLFSISL